MRQTFLASPAIVSKSRGTGPEDFRNSGASWRYHGLLIPSHNFTHLVYFKVYLAASYSAARTMGAGDWLTFQSLTLHYVPTHDHPPNAPKEPKRVPHMKPSPPLLGRPRTIGTIGTTGGQLSGVPDAPDQHREARVAVWDCWSTYPQCRWFPLFLTSFSFFLNRGLGIPCKKVGYLRGDEVGGGG